MGDSRGRDWQRALDEVEQAVRGCLTALNHYETRFHELLDAPPGPPPAPLPTPPESWTDRLDQVRHETEMVERLLDEQEAAWTRWREALTSWRQSVKQSPGRSVAEHS
jgi:hypothetical protein